LVDEGVASEAVGDAFAVIIEEAIHFEDEVVEVGIGRFRDDDGGDTLDVLVGAVAELGDLLIVIDFGEFVEV